MKFSCLLVLVGLIWLGPACSAPTDISDDRGRVIRLHKPAQRIISLAPHITELLYEAGADKQVTATVEFSDHPEAARAIPRIGNYSKFDFEAIVAAKPDLIIAWYSGNPREQMQAIHQLGVPVFYSEPTKLTDIAQTIENFGQMLGTEAEARRQANQFRNRLRQLRARYHNRRPVRVFYQVWNRPLMTINGQHIISDVIRLCGGENIFAALPVKAPGVDMESVLLHNPQVIIAGINEQRNDWLQEWGQWPGIAAVSRGHVYGIDPDLVSRHTSRILDGTRQVCDFIEKARK